MKVKILSKGNKEKGTIELPQQFNEEVRADIIQRAVETIHNNTRQRFGADPEAGQKVSAELSRRRHKYRGSYGYGISRVPRKIMSRNGTRFNWVGALMPGTRGGRNANPPKAEKIWSIKLNKKEKRKSIRSAMSANMIKEIVQTNYINTPENYPFILDESFEKIEKTQEILTQLKKLGFEKELERAKIRKVRPGKGKSRGRKYKKKKSILFVVSEKCPLIKALKNMPGADVIVAKNLNTKLLAPGKVPGRITLWTEKAIKEVQEKKLFI